MYKMGMVREARPDDLGKLREIERAAGEVFRSLGMHAVAHVEQVSVHPSHARQGLGSARCKPSKLVCEAVLQMARCHPDAAVSAE
jgi:hypothetical protein